MKNIGIIGAGWLGMDWVNRLSGNEKYHIRYTNRSSKNKLASEIENCDAYSFEFGKELPENFTENLDFLFITATLPKEKKETPDHLIEELKMKLPAECVIIFTSTIGVYSSENGIIDETSELLDKDSVYLQFEQLLFSNFPDKTIIARLGGLTGEDRHPVFSLTGRKNIADGQKAVNLIHKEDILNFFRCIIQNSVTCGIYNLVYPKHPSRNDYYTQKAKENNLDLPEFTIGTEPGKTISSIKSELINGFSYQYEI